ncbi:helix-turn-helix domain-containing protein [Massilia jejuensis]|uniref:Helix-turn-helix domain-containing protein n=1 Tax=Massilia jejuensis TaxID=648894 RepID=A0ABW0PHD4_9BURK
MTAKDVLRSQVMAQVVEGKLDQASAASRLGISVRQVKRLKRRLQDEGTQGLLSQKRGVPSNRRTPPEMMAKAAALIRKHYADFGPTLACEKLQELHEIKLSVETVRQAMLGAGLWKARRGAGIRTHAIRERGARRGELIQIDGSPHDWFEGRAPRCCLLVFIDDATSEVQPADRGLALRGADVTIVTHPASPTEVLWQGRVLPHTLSSKAIRQQEAVDGKEVNRKVDRALSRRTPPQPVGHPWKKKMSTAPGKAPPCAQFEHTKAPLALAPAS